MPLDKYQRRQEYYHKRLEMQAALPPDQQASPLECELYDMCFKTGRSKANLLSLAAYARGDPKLFLATLGYKTCSWPVGNRDNLYWRTILQYIKLFIPVYEKKVLRVKMENALSIPSKEQREDELRAISVFCGMDPDDVLYYAEHGAAIENFIIGQRNMIGMIAERNLIKIIVAGNDATTLRWYLERTKPDIFGGSNKVTKNEMTYVLEEGLVDESMEPD